MPCLESHEQYSTSASVSSRQERGENREERGEKRGKRGERIDEREGVEFRKNMMLVNR
eukprot:SAG11_NODE_15_length_26319_cov_13.810564_10_plen_58_part_00